MGHTCERRLSLWPTPYASLACDMTSASEVAVSGLRRSASVICLCLYRLPSCIIRVSDWVARNRLKLNEDKTQVIWLRTRQQLDKVMVQTLELQNAMVPFSSVVNDLGVLLYSELTWPI